MAKTLPSGCQKPRRLWQKPLTRDWLRPARWQPLVAGAWRHYNRIHDRECRTSLWALRRECALGANRGSTVLSIGDNLSEVLALERGRARNRDLNAVCRQACGLRLATGIAWRRRHVESERNVSDADSRLAAPIVAHEHCYV